MNKTKLSKLKLSAEALSRTLLRHYCWSVPMVQDLIRATIAMEKEMKKDAGNR